MKKKSQMEIMQSTMILLLVFVLFAIVLIFFFSHQRSKIKEKETLYADLEMIKKSQMLNFFPELQCSFDNIIDPDCFDLGKIAAFEYDNDYYYKNLLGNVKINLLKWDLETNNWQTIADESYPTIVWTADEGYKIFDNKKDDDKTTKKKQVNLPISIYDPKQDKYYFGLIKYQVYR